MLRIIILNVSNTEKQIVDLMKNFTDHKQPLFLL